MNCNLTLSSRFHYRYGGGVPAHQHSNDYQIQLICEGSMDVRVDSLHFHASRGDVIFIMKDSSHEFRVTSENGMRTLEVKFWTDDEELIALLKSIRICQRDNKEKIFGILSRIIVEGYRQIFPYRILSNAILLEGLALLARMSKNGDPGIGSAMEDNQEQSKLLKDVMQYISTDGNRKLTVKDIAESCGLSSDYFSRVIRRETGMSAIQFINEMKFKQARLMIQNTELSLSEIAWSLGFSSIQYFSRFFRQHAGVSPSEYLSEARNLMRTDY